MSLMYTFIIFFSGQFCGTDAKGITVTSSGNEMMILFVSDGSVGDRGVKIRWESIPLITLTDVSRKLF